ncbi:MAG: [citrate (pro-3S)-lyase] ligase [Chloroflexia bacterium]|nr:[citrate (pro-3S)-lyase] ligase [Chloroflexia bacterium]
MDFSTKDFTNYRIEEMDLALKADVQLIEGFTNAYELPFDKRSVDYTIALFDEHDKIIGTGSFSGNILKYVLIDIAHRESNAFAQITTHLINKVLENHRHIFVYTLPRHIPLFENLGFKLVAKAPPLFCMLEFGVESVKDYVNYLEGIKSKDKHKKIASIVVNCNPFTKGHQHLIEKASKENDLVYLFVVQEDLSVFPFKIRWQLIKEGIAHLGNVIMVEGSHYVVSGATFPSYFLKAEKTNAIIDNQAELDIQIFRKYITKTLDITHRYVGTEKNCETTAAYNKAMHKILPDYSVQVIENERIKRSIDGNEYYISASKIREALKEDKLELYYDSLPESTLKFLLSEEAKPIIERIKSSDKRH